jgi:hypothetical protein
MKVFNYVLFNTLNMTGGLAEFYVPERVHIAPVWLEIDRVILPFLEMKGDRMHLILRKGWEEYWRKSSEIIMQELEKYGGGCEVHTLPFEDLFLLIKDYREIIRSELDKTNYVFVNLSSGGNHPAVAGHFATLTFGEKVIAYFAQPKDYVKNIDEGRPQRSIGLSNVSILPHYTIELPGEEHVRFMKMISEKQGVGMKTLRDLCVDEGLISINRSKSRSYGHVILESRFIRPLMKQGLVETEGHERRRTVYLTDKGKSTLKLAGLI